MPPTPLAPPTPLQSPQPLQAAPEAGSARTSWWLDGSLLLLALYGAVMTFPLTREVRMLRSQRQALEAKVGSMPIQDKKRYHVMLLESDRPYEFKWRIYSPDAVKPILSVVHWSQNSGGSSQSHWSDHSKEGLVTATFSFSDNQQHADLYISHRHQNSTGRHGGSMGDSHLLEAIRSGDFTHWKIAGRDGIETFAEDELVWLIQAGEYEPAGTPNRKPFFGIAVGSKGVD